MKVLLLSHSGGVGGATRSLQVVARHLSELGANVSMLAPKGPMHEEWADDGVETQTWTPPYCPWLGGAIYSSGLVKFRWIMLALLGVLPWRVFKAYKLLKEKILQEEPDYLHINSLTMFPLFTILGRLRKNTNIDFKVVWHLRELLNPQLCSPVKKWIIRGITKESETIIAITENEAEPFQQADPVIIYNTIPISWGDVMPTQKPKKECFKVVMAAALSPAKGIKEYLEIAKRVRAEYPQAQFDLFTPKSATLLKTGVSGCEDTAEFLEKEFAEISELELAGGATWKMGHKITRELYEEYDLLIRPDRAGCPWGRDIIEALWMGLPVIATGTFSGFVKPNENGFLVDVGDVDQMVQRVIECIEDDEMMQSLRENAQHFANKKLNPDVHRRKLAAVYHLQ